MLFANLKTILLLSFENIYLQCLTWSDPWKPPQHLSTHSAFHSVILSKMLIYPHVCLRVHAHDIPFSWNTLHPIFHGYPFMISSLHVSSQISSLWSEFSPATLRKFPLLPPFITFCKLFYSKHLQPPNNLIFFIYLSVSPNPQLECNLKYCGLVYLFHCSIPVLRIMPAL